MKSKQNLQISNLGVWIALLLALIVIDQLVKNLAQSSIQILYNEAFAFSLRVPIILMYVVYGTVIIAISHYVNKNFSRLTSFALFGWTLILAGGLSNVGERIILGSVRDFIPLLGGTLNLADLFIIAGIIVVIISSRFKK
jgi:lipoprotein signal peptidase